MDLPIQEECAVPGPLGFVLRMSKIFGLAPLKFKRVRKGCSICVSFAANLYGVAVLSLIFLMSLAYLVCDYNVERHLSNHFKTSSDAVAAIVVIVIVQLVLLVAIYSGSQRMQSMITSLAYIQKINADLHQYGPPPLYKCKSLTLIPISSCIGAWLNYSIMYGVTLYIMFLEKKYNFLWLGLHSAVDMAIIMNKLLILQVTLILAAIPVSLHHLNHCLWNLLQQIRDQYTINEHCATMTSTVKRLRTLYSALNCIVKHINGSHGMLLSVFIAYFIIVLVITLYNIIMVVISMFESDDPNSVVIILAHITWLMMQITDLVMIIEPCHRAHAQMERTKRLIGRILLLTPPKHHEVIHELELFYKYLMNDVVYTPMGIFYLNRTVIVTVFGCITTYLVVIVKL